MADIQVSMTAEERQWLHDFLERTLRNMRVEEHRTRTISFREHVLHQEALILRLLDKLREPVAQK
jgi:hypothetical protein